MYTSEFIIYIYFSAESHYFVKGNDGQLCSSPIEELVLQNNPINSINYIGTQSGDEEDDSRNFQRKSDDGRGSHRGSHKNRGPHVLLAELQTKNFTKKLIRNWKLKIMKPS